MVQGEHITRGRQRLCLFNTPKDDCKEYVLPSAPTPRALIWEMSREALALQAPPGSTSLSGGFPRRRAGQAGLHSKSADAQEKRRMTLPPNIIVHDEACLKNIWLLWQCMLWKCFEERRTATAGNGQSAGADEEICIAMLPV